MWGIISSLITTLEKRRHAVWLFKKTEKRFLDSVCLRGDDVRLMAGNWIRLGAIVYYSCYLKLKRFQMRGSVLLRLLLLLCNQNDKTDGEEFRLLLFFYETRAAKKDIY